jgi:arginase family enzyme
MEVWDGGRTRSSVAWLRPGVPAFAGLPVARRVDDLTGAGAAVIGIPFASRTMPDGAGHDHTAADGPQQVRRASLAYVDVLDGRALVEPGAGHTVADRLRVVDYGDVALAADAERDLAASHERLIDIVAAGAVPLVLGGDHVAGLAALQVVAGRVRGKLGLVVLDGRFDLEGSSTLVAGAQWERAFKLDVLDPSSFVQIGVRGPCPLEQRRAAGLLGHRYYPASEVAAVGIATVVREALEIATRGTEAVYVSLDLAVLDPVHGGVWVEPGGLGAGELLDALATLARAPLAGFDVCCDMSAEGAAFPARFAARAVTVVAAGLASQYPDGHARR